MKCEIHKEKNASFKCPKCQCLFCEECVDIFEIGNLKTFICRECDNQCVQVEISNGKITETTPWKQTAPVQNQIKSLEKKSSFHPPGIHKIPEEPPLNKPISAETSDSQKKSDPEGMISGTPTTQLNLADFAYKTPPKENIPDKKEDEIPSLLYIFSKSLWKPGFAFRNFVRLLSQSSLFRIKFSVGIFILVSFICFFKMINPAFVHKTAGTSFLLSLVFSLAEIFLFSMILTLGAKKLGNIEQLSSLGIFIFGIASFFYVLQYALLLPVIDFSLPWLAFLLGFLILLFKIYVFAVGLVKGFECERLGIIFLLLLGAIIPKFLVKITLRFFYA